MGLSPARTTVLRMDWEMAVTRSSNGTSAATPRFQFRMAHRCSRSQRRVPKSLRRRLQPTEQAYGDEEPLTSPGLGAVILLENLVLLSLILSRRNGSMKDRRSPLSPMEWKAPFVRQRKPQA